jgi:broad specificity phosphatase PhoE
MKRAVVALALLLASVAQTAPITTVILIRHAERVSTTDKDSAISDAGLERAAALANMLHDANIRAVYVTQYKRTQQTAKPFGIEPVIVGTTATYAADVVDRIRKEHTGETVLVISHSNTIPDVIRQLGVANPPAIGDNVYDNVFIVTTAGNASKLTTLHVPMH